MAVAAIPNRAVFRAEEVCEIAEVQPYVLRSWESEFPDLGVRKTPSGPRVYRRADIERVLRLKHLLFVDGLTLAGARKQLAQEGTRPSPDAVSDVDMVAMLDQQNRQGLRELRGGLQWILGVLNGRPKPPDPFELRPQSVITRDVERRAAPVAEEKTGKKPVKRKR